MHPRIAHEVNRGFVTKRRIPTAKSLVIRKWLEMYRLGLAENPNLNLHRRLRYHRNLRMAVQPINKVRESLGEFHHLFQQLEDHPGKFFQYTRMHRKTFNIILEAITPFIERKVTNFKKPIPATMFWISRIPYGRSFFNLRNQKFNIHLPTPRLQLICQRSR